MVEHDQAAKALAITLLPFGLLVALGCFLVTNPDTAAAWIWPVDERTETVQVSDELNALLFAVSGIVVLAAALPDLVTVMLQLMSTGDRQTIRPQWVAGHVLRVVLGLFLFFRPGVVLGFWRRHQARPRSSEAGSPDDRAA